MKGIILSSFFKKNIKIFILLGLLFANSASLSVNSSFSEFRDLEKGHVVKRTVNGNAFGSSKVLEGAEYSILINAPTEKVWGVLDNKRNLPKFIHQIEDIEILKNNEKEETVRTTIKLCKVLPTFNYVLSFDKSDKYRKIKFVKTEGCFKDLFGQIEFIPYKNATILNYRVFSDPGFYIPEFVRKGLRSDAKDLMRTIKKEVEK